MRVLVKYFYFTVGLRWKKGEIKVSEPTLHRFFFPYAPTLLFP